jgi:hypothetical protein
MVISAAVAFGLLSSCVPPSGNWASPYSTPSSAATPSAYDDEEQEPPARGNSGGAYTCSAEATVGTSNDSSGPWLDREISIMGQGHTRDDAYDEAFSSCGSIVTTTLAIGETGSGYAEVRSACRVTDCTHW